MVDLGWLSSYQPLIAPSMCSGFGVFILRQFFLSMPVEIEDAARIDGAGSWQIFTRLLLPPCAGGRRATRSAGWTQGR
jgi:multiple sugar transport system permease protein